MPLWRRRHQQQPPAPTRHVQPSTPLPAPTPPPPAPVRTTRPSPDELIGTRPRWQVERLQAEAARSYESYRRDPADRALAEWQHGITSAARWALGELESAPISGTRTGAGVLPGTDLMEDEDDRAEWALRHPREAGYSYSYSNGVQHCLMWITGDTDDSPIDFDD